MFTILSWKICHILSQEPNSHPARDYSPFTYVSEAWGSTSWLDHCFATKDGNNIITSISVDYDCHLSDHFPLNINVCCDLAPKLEERCSNRTQKIDWAKASQRDIHRYTTRADVLLRDMQNMHHELVGCTDMNCHNRNHIESIEKYYNDICNCLATASCDTIGNRSHTNHNKPGWSEAGQNMLLSCMISQESPLVIGVFMAALNTALFLMT